MITTSVTAGLCVFAFITGLAAGAGVGTAINRRGTVSLHNIKGPNTPMPKVKVYEVLLNEEERECLLN